MADHPVSPTRSATNIIVVYRYVASQFAEIVPAACRYAKWTPSIMSIDAPHGHAYVIVRHDPTRIQCILRSGRAEFEPLLIWVNRMHWPGKADSAR